MELQDNKTLPMIAMCDPDACPMTDKCTVGPVPNLPCPIKAAFFNELNDQIALSFREIDKNPDVSTRVNMMVKPLFETLLKLRMAENNNPEVYFGNKVNPLFKEIRQTILALDKVLSETIKLYHNGPITGSKPTHVKGDPLNMGGKSYYEMLMVDGTASVEERTGPLH